MSGSLYVVSTPIGNLDDITLRALKTLKAVGLIAAEDTRRTSILLRHFGIETPTTSLHEHNEHEKVPQLLDRLEAGTDIALVSDAGTPLVADPGQRLVAAAVTKGVRIIPIPGASAILAALVSSGFPVGEFVFAGFPPSRSNDRDQWLRRLSAEQRPIVFFEAPHRISRTLDAIARYFGERPISVCRELTKIHEEVIRTIAIRLNELSIKEKGEFTVILGAASSVTSAEEVSDEELAAFIGHLTTQTGASKRRAAALAAAKFGLSTNHVYAAMERLKASLP
jgi:16S rRNA (cytidine1402-2'-O)-methyltransferase